MKDTQEKMQMEMQATILAEGLTEFVEQIDSQMGADDFILSKQAYGTKETAASGSLGAVSLLIVLAGALLTGFSYFVFTRGGIAGDPTADEIMLRVGSGFIGAMALLNLISILTGVSL